MSFTVSGLIATLTNQTYQKVRNFCMSGTARTGHELTIAYKSPVHTHTQSTDASIHTFMHTCREIHKNNTHSLGRCQFLMTHTHTFHCIVLHSLVFISHTHTHTQMNSTLKLNGWTDVNHYHLATKTSACCPPRLSHTMYVFHIHTHYHVCV